MIFPQAYMLDFNGVLVNSDAFYSHAVAQISHELKIPFNQDVFEIFYAGKTLSEGLPGYLAWLAYPIDQEDLITRVRDVDHKYAEWVKGYQDAINLAKLLSITGNHVSLVTGSRRTHVDAMLPILGLTGTFHEIITVENYRNKKPAPDPYLEAMRRLPYPMHVNAIENSRNGLRSAYAAGIENRVLVRRFGQFVDPEYATEVVRELWEYSGNHETQRYSNERLG